MQRSTGSSPQVPPAARTGTALESPVRRLYLPFAPQLLEVPASDSQVSSRKLPRADLARPAAPPWPPPIELAASGYRAWSRKQPPSRSDPLLAQPWFPLE